MRYEELEMEVIVFTDEAVATITGESDEL